MYCPAAGADWARAVRGAARGASPSASRMRRRSGFISVCLCGRWVLHFDHAGGDSVLGQRLSHPVDVVMFCIWTDPHAVPGPLVGPRRRLHARIDAENGELRLLVVGFGGVLERS